MLARLGNVLYWGSCGLAALCVLGALSNLGNGFNDIFFGFLIAAVLIWLIGRAARYVFAGT